MKSESEVWELLNQVRDPEIPTVSIIEMGMVHHLEVERRQRPRVLGADLFRVSGA